jgi:uncharacterized BrkB/YihY/UPF0761 family membrane protein
VANPLFFNMFLLLVLGIPILLFTIPGAMKVYQELANNPWWEMTPGQRNRYFIRRVIYFLFWSIVLTIALVFLTANRPASPTDAISLWLTCLIWSVVAITHRRKSRRAPQGYRPWEQQNHL